MTPHLLQAIHVKYHGPTNTRGGRYTARCASGSVTIDYDHDKGPSENAADAARMLAVKMGWENARIGGVMPDGSYVFVLCPMAD